MALAATAASACTNFENPTTVIDLRMLAVQVEPSEIILAADLSNPAMPVVDPANNPPVKVTSLIADPQFMGRELAYTISACPNDPFATAAPGGGQGGGTFPSGGARTTVGSALCDESSPTTWVMASGMTKVGDSRSAEPVAMVSPSIDQLTIAFMKDIFPDQFGNLHGGFDLGMPLTLDIKIDAVTEQIRGVKRVLYWAQRINDAQVANQLPEIPMVDAFYFRDEDTLDPIDPPQLLEKGTPLTVAAGHGSLWIRPAPGIAESFQTTVIDPDTHRAVPFTVERETLRYRFFATMGTFASAMTSSEPPPGFVPKGPIHIESRWDIPLGQIVTPTDVTIWIVVRDDRGGESWAERTMHIDPL